MHLNPVTVNARDAVGVRCRCTRDDQRRGNAELSRSVRIRQTPDERDVRRRDDAASRSVRARQTADKRIARRRDHADLMRSVRARQTPDERDARRQENAERMRTGCLELNCLCLVMCNNYVQDRVMNKTKGIVREVGRKFVTVEKLPERRQSIGSLLRYTADIVYKFSSLGSCFASRCPGVE